MTNAKKSTTQQKIDELKPLVIPFYEEHGAGYSKWFDKFAMSIFPDIENYSFSLMELPALVKAVGIEEKYILSLEERKEKASSEILGRVQDTFEDYDHFCEVREDIAKEFNVPVNYVKGQFKEQAKLMGITLPKKDHLKDWQRAIVNHWLETEGDTNAESMVEYINANADTKSAEHFTSNVLPILQELQKINS